MSETAVMEKPAEAGNPYKRGYQVTNEFLQKYSVKRQGQDVVLVKGLLHLAHELGFRGIKTRFVQFPTKENDMTAFAETEVIDEFGRVWVDGGDANANNVGGQVKPHYPRMALTRSKGRALRDALGLGLLVDEELEVMVETARSGMGGNTAKATNDQFNVIKDLRTEKGKDRDWVIDMAFKLFEKAPGDLTEAEANVVIVLLEELPAVPVAAE